MANTQEEIKDGVCLGTPLEEAQSFLLSRKQPLTNRAPRVWEQIVTDDRGRRRLHGAFTGGFSAGYFNTVDTKEGFTPKTFKTSRSHRAEDRKQEIHDFYDEDELEELQRVKVVTQDAYDTFSSVKQERIKERTEAEAAARPIIPGGVIDEFVEGVPDSIGVKLLQKMGWRQGKGIGEAFKSATETEIELGWGPEASVLQESVKIWKYKPKMNTHGLGFDPFRGSSDFERLKNKPRISEKPQTKRSRGIAFGVGALEETDTFGEMVDYVDNSVQDPINYYDMSDESDGGKQATKHHPRDFKLLENRKNRVKEDESFVAGFRLSAVLKEQKTFQLPVVPPSFIGRLKTSHSVDDSAQDKAAKLAIPTAKIPSDQESKRLIDSVAVFVAKGGYLSEELVREEHQGDEKYSFLFGGEGSEYYRWKLLGVKVTFQKLGVSCLGQRETPLTADDRGYLLGDEKIKEETKNKKYTSAAVSHPNLLGVPEADRTRVQAALKSTFVKGSQETALQTEEVIPGLRAPKPKDQTTREAGNEAKSQKALDSLVPVRWFLDWHPVPLLYKRFKIADPFKGQIQEAEVTSKFMSYEAQLDEVKNEDSSALSPNPVVSIANEVDISLPPPEYTEPPLDIFKSIFDASDDEQDKETKNKEIKDKEMEDRIPEKESIETGKKLSETNEQASDPPRARKKLNLSSDEEPEVSRQEDKESSSESFDESIFQGLSTSEFKKLLKTLKKGQKKKSQKRHKKKKKRKSKS